MKRKDNNKLQRLISLCLHSKANKNNEVNDIYKFVYIGIIKKSFITLHYLLELGSDFWVLLDAQKMPPMRAAIVPP